jgi:glycosyltransferase involved in cell wall biosynthesis
MVIGASAEGTRRRRRARPDEGLVWSDPRTWVRIGREARGHDRVVLVWVTPLQAPALAVVARLAGAGRAIAMVHNGRPHERGPLDRMLTRVGLGRVGRVVVHAPSIVDDLRHQGVTAEATVVPFPPQSALAPTPLPEGPLRMLLFGETARAYKGADVLLEAVAMLRRRRVALTLTVAGGVRSTEALRAAARRLGIEDSVDVRPGWVPDERLQALFAEHHLVVLPYRSATASGIVPLARAAGRPVVATAVGGLADVVHDGVDGILCEPGDPAALADALLEAWEAREQLARGIPHPMPTWSAVAAMVVGVVDPRATTSSASRP